MDIRVKALYDLPVQTLEFVDGVFVFGFVIVLAFILTFYGADSFVDLFFCFNPFRGRGFRFMIFTVYRIGFF